MSSRLPHWTYLQPIKNTGKYNMHQTTNRIIPQTFFYWPISEHLRKSRDNVVQHVYNKKIKTECHIIGKQQSITNLVERIANMHAVTVSHINVCSTVNYFIFMDIALALKKYFYHLIKDNSF